MGSLVGTLYELARLRAGQGPRAAQEALSCMTHEGQGFLGTVGAFPGFGEQDWKLKTEWGWRGGYWWEVCPDPSPLPWNTLPECLGRGRGREVGRPQTCPTPTQTRTPHKEAIWCRVHPTELRAKVP